MQILLIHGRAQEEFNQETLLKNWTDALKLSFYNAKLDFPQDLVLTLPYYGKELITQRNLYKKDIMEGKFIMRSPGEENDLEESYNDLLEALRQNAGISKKEVSKEAEAIDQHRGAKNWRITIALARMLDQKLNSVGNNCVKRATDDVATYLIVPEARKKINDVYLQAFKEQPTIVIAHSLGTVIAYDILSSLPPEEYEVHGLITLGSPLGVHAVNRQFLSMPTYPKSLRGPWVNIYDSKDIVSLNPLNDKHFRVTPPINNHEIENNSENRHDIVPYLSHPLVAETIHKILKG